MRHLVKPTLLAVLLLVDLQAVYAQETGIVTIEGTRIRGDQEVPTVMYLVPWQPPEVDELQAPDERLMVEQTFTPLERYEFQRLVRYHDAFIREAATAKQSVR
ncbi:hypothetical protein [Marinobacter maritimus]|uniref:hypothetical protein n=1 Tax=Marinobacter maritimus TaxID=277961 RepID=UPI0011A927A3|nr:hypothetical protein [Marinobacter maritimus]